MPPRRTLLLALSASALSVTLLAPRSSAQAERVPTPAEHLGHPLAADFRLPGWDAVRGWFELLAAQSPRVVLEPAGATTEGRQMVLAVISSEANLARIEELKQHARRLSDPRGASDAERARARSQARPFLMISCAMHATECAGPQFAMAFAHELATSDDQPWKSAREELVVLLIPSTNPDGQDLVADWYMQTVGTPFEGADLTRLYQLYAGHDNNRDWFTLSQAETRNVSRLLYEVWRPQVYWDVHQQGSRGERLFVPPFRDPLNPNLDPGVMGLINLVGARAQVDLLREGKTGVASGGTYDMWWNGGNRNVPVRHNIVGLLTEAASARLASPLFLPRSELRAPDGTSGYAPSNSFLAPWPGGWWRLGDIVEYELGFARSLLATLVRERELFLSNASDAAERALQAGEQDVPRAWLLPADQPDVLAVERLVGALLGTGVEVEVTRDELRADGRSWPAGSVLVRRAQPYGQYVKDLFELQRYPDGADAPYDVAGWSLPLLFGVRCVPISERVEARAEPVREARLAVARFPGPEAAPELGAGEFLDTRDGRAWLRAFEHLRGGGALALGTAREHSGLFVPRAGGAPLQGSSDPIDVPAGLRIGLYAPWSGEMAEGWARWVLDTFGVPYATVRNEALRAGDLARSYDVLVLPGTDARELREGRSEGSVQPEYAHGLGPDGAAALEAFVRGGGTLVALGASARYAVDELGLPLVELTAADSAKGFSCPGSVLRAIPERARLTAGLPLELAVFGSRPQAWRAMDAKEREARQMDLSVVDVLLRYAPTQLLQSGWIAKPEVLQGQPAWLRVQHGRGAVHLFGFQPHYRSWSQQSFQLLFRAILLR